MTAVDDVRAKLRDRQTKPGARGTVEEYVPLDLELIDELVSLQTSLIDARERAAGKAATPEARTKTKKRLSDGGAVELDPDAEDPEIVQLEAEVAAAEKALRDNSLRLTFRSIGSQAYSALVGRHPDADDSAEARRDFLNAMLSECLHRVATAEGEVLDGLTWAEIAYPNGEDSEGPLSYGEWQRIANAVSALNRRTVDFPFSLRSSGPTRS